MFILIHVMLCYVMVLNVVVLGVSQALSNNVYIYAEFYMSHIYPLTPRPLCIRMFVTVRLFLQIAFAYTPLSLFTPARRFGNVCRYNREEISCTLNTLAYMLDI